MFHRDFKKNVICFVLLFIVGVTIYSNTFHVPFLFDDARNIQHTNLKMDELTVKGFIGALFGGVLRTRPIANLSFALNYYFTGFDVFGYHLVNILFHVLTAFFVYLVFQETLILPVNREIYKKFKLIPELTALLWLVHPLATQSVTYIVQRMNLLATFFYVFSLYCYIRGRKRQQKSKIEQYRKQTWIFFFLSGLSAIFAIGSKEIAATLPGFIFLYEWFFLQDLSIDWLKKQRPWIFGLIAAFCGLVLLYTHGHPLSYILHGCDHRNFTLSERILTQPRVIWHYISLLLYPSPQRLVFDYDFPVSTSLLEPITTILSIFGIVGALSVIPWLARRERLLSFAILWFFGNLVIESSVICLEMVFEHRTYLPSIFCVLFCVLLLFRIVRNRVVIFSILIPLIALFSFWTYQRNAIWQGPITFWQDSVDKYPGKARARTNLSTALYEAGQHTKAKKELQFVLKNNPQYALAHHNLAIILAEQGQYQDAIKHEQRALQRKPMQRDIYKNLAAFYEKIGKIQKTEHYLLQGRHLFPEDSYFPRSLAALYMRTKQNEKALSLLLQAQKVFPDDIDVMQLLAEAYEKLGRTNDAIKIYKHIVAIGPSSPALHAYFARILSISGRSQEALHQYLAAVDLGLEDALIFYNIGNLYLRANHYNAAISNYRKAVRLDSNNPNIYNNMGLAYARQGRYKQAALFFARVIELDPDSTLAGKNLLLVKKKMKKEEAASLGKDL